MKWAVRPEGERAPLNFRVLCRVLGLDKPLTRHWWAALWAGQQPCCTQIRSSILLADCDPQHLDPEVLLINHLLPTKLVHCLEGLVSEKLLTRRHANAIEAVILERTIHDGSWRREQAARREEKTYAHR